MSNKSFSEENSKENNEITLKELLEPYLKKWYWFALGVLLMAILGILLIKRMAPQYKITSTVLIKDAKSPGGGDFAAIRDLSGFGKLGSDGVDNEIIVFESRELLATVIKELGLETKVYQEGIFRDTELYGVQSPIIVKYIAENTKSGKFFKKPLKVEISGDEVTLTSDELKKPVSGKFGSTFRLPYATLMILKNEKYDNTYTKKKDLKQMKLALQPFENTVVDYEKLLKAGLINKEVTIIELNMNYPVKEKAIDFINKLVEVYNRQALLDKNAESRRTAEFIDERIQQVGKDLGDIDFEKERFKESNNITNLEMEAGLGLQVKNQVRSRQVEVENQLDITNALLNYVNRKGSYDVLPVNVGLENDGVSEAISDYNELVAKRKQLLENATTENPLVVDISQKINSMREVVKNSLQKHKDGIITSRNNYLQDINNISQQMSKMPYQERMFRDIERQQRIKEELYLLLLQKREETHISLAMTGEKARIIDYAYSSLKPVAPNKILIFLTFLVMGILIPLMILYLKRIFENTVKTKRDIEKLTHGKPIVGEVPTIEKGQSELVTTNDLSPLAESFRIFFTNLNYLLPKTNAGKVILVTSTVKGEGKTFVSVNLALSLAASGKKVIIVGSDIRNPQLQRYDPASKSFKGLTEYLYDSSVTVPEIIHKASFGTGCDVIYSGSIPPNPIELLMKTRYEEMVNILKKEYEYVILDSAPTMPVTDTMLIAGLADATIYVVRSRFTELNLLDFADRNINEGKLKNVGFVLNDLKREHYGYGNKYGYGYGADNLSFFERLKRKLFG